MYIQQFTELLCKLFVFNQANDICHTIYIAFFCIFSIDLRKWRANILDSLFLFNFLEYHFDKAYKLLYIDWLWNEHFNFNFFLFYTVGGVTSKHVFNIVHLRCMYIRAGLVSGEIIFIAKNTIVHPKNMCRNFFQHPNWKSHQLRIKCVCVCVCFKRSLYVSNWEIFILYINRCNAL